MKKFSMNKSKRAIATIVLIVFLGTIVLSGLAALITSIAMGGETRVVTDSVPAGTPALLPSEAPGEKTENSAADVKIETENKQEAADENSAPEATDVKVYTPNIKPEIKTEIVDKTLKITAKVNAPDGIVFSANAYGEKDLLSPRADVKATLKDGAIAFNIPIKAESGEGVIGILKLDMRDNAQNSAAVSLYGKSGEKIIAAGENATISEYKNGDGTISNVYYYKFTTTMK